MNEIDAMISRARQLLELYQAAKTRLDLAAARNAAYELVGTACALHTAADPGADGKQRIGS